MARKRGRRLTAASFTVAVCIYVYTYPDIQHVAEFLFKAVFRFGQ